MVLPDAPGLRRRDGFRTCSITATFIAGLLLAGCPQPKDQSAPPRASVHAGISFSCLWWSEAQMEGLNPNAPPPKSTEVKITKWEYSDPVGVPHPDTVDVVVTLTNQSGSSLNAEVQVDGQWKEGSLSASSDAAWSARRTLQRFHDISLPPSGSRSLRVPVEIKTVMESLDRQRKWPYALRVTVTVRAQGSAQMAGETVAELPIARAD